MIETSIFNTTSAGGIIVRKYGNVTEIVVGQRSKRVEEKWKPVLRQLPKGCVQTGESLEEAALREVLEETGFHCIIIGFAGNASWSYQKDGKYWFETVHYYLMDLASMSQSQTDSEFEEILWLPIAEAAEKLSYPEERALLNDLVRRLNS